MNPAIGPVVLGTMTFGSQVDRAVAGQMIATASDAGVTMFDTSNNYNAGAAEEILGQLVKPFRDQVQISTKVGSHVDPSDPSAVGLRRKSIEAAVEASLRRLQTDYIDVYYFHRPDWETPIEESLEAADHLIRSGKVRQLGQSNFAAWQVAEMRELALRHDWAPVSVCQIMYNLVARRVETEYASCSKHYGLVNIAYNPLAGGLLTGKHRIDERPPVGTRFTKGMYKDRYWNATQFEAVKALSDLARDSNLSLIELALRWVRDRPLTDAVLLGASNVQQLRGNLQALYGPALSPEQLQRCDEIWQRVGGIAPDYNR